MSLLRKISTILKKAGYKKEKAIPEVDHYKKWYDERYAAGFSIMKRPRRELTDIGFGLLDVELTKTLNKIEGTEDFGLYHLTAAKALIDKEQAIAFGANIEQHFLEILNNQLIILDKDMPLIIEQYQNAMTKPSPVPYFLDPKSTHKRFGYIYYGLVYSLIENKQLTPLDIDNAIEFATQLGVYNVDFQYKIDLLKKYVGMPIEPLVSN